MSIVSFIGAGPGDPELITLKAVDRIKSAGLILYAGSLVPESVFIPHTTLTRDAIFSSADLTLEETHQLIMQAIGDGKSVARIHTGDPSIYGAIYEQMARLDADGIGYEVIPGISSAMAAAAALKSEFTIPDGTQTVMFTRIHGKTPVPESEDLEQLAAHRSTMVIFLSAHKAGEVVEKLTRHFPVTTPAAIAYRVGWPDMKLIRSTLENVPSAMQQHGIVKQALILVGDTFGEKKKSEVRSVLYGKEKRVQHNG
ncbi:MAG: precorrin-4 C(11)-methyltransferase [Thermodesulfobacteriota bacterium]|nr:precorrin-4 C(11)-methyltransferase [Thermodesulfobacteriota bacterium]